MIINKTAASNTIMVISNVNSSSCAFFIRICRLASQLHSRNRSACKSFSYVSNPWELSKTDAISYIWRFKIPFISIQAVVVAASSATHPFLDEPPNRRYSEQSTESPILDAPFWSENGVSCPCERNKIGDSAL
jgi:hypothetical protein